MRTITPSDSIAIIVRDSDGMAWRVERTDCVTRDDEKVEALTPRGEKLILPPFDSWEPNRIYNSIKD